MSERPLDEAIGALRDEESLAPGDSLGTRSRVLATLDRRRHQRQAWTVVAMVAACCLVGTTSWAWVTGWLPARLGLPAAPVEQTLSGGRRGAGRAPDEARTSQEKSPAVATLGPGAAPLAAPASARAPAIAPAAPSAPAIAPVATEAPRAIAPTPPNPPVVAPSAPTIAPAPPRPPVVAPVAPRAPATKPVAPRAPSIARQPAAPAIATEPAAAPPARAIAPTVAPAAPAPDPELAAFRRAHEAHFGGGAPLAVLALWDDYLARFAAGRLAPEARWNRAILLVRVGRVDAARAALASFASGAEGGYRQRDAEDLLRTLP